MSKYDGVMRLLLDRAGPGKHGELRKLRDAARELVEFLDAKPEVIPYLPLKPGQIELLREIAAMTDHQVLPG